MSQLKALEIPGAILGWQEDTEFRKIADKLSGISASPIYKLYTLWQMLPHVKSLEGYIAEVGVFRGGSAKIICEAMKKHGIAKKLLLFDTFAGMPKVNKQLDQHREGDFKNTSLPEVMERLKAYNACEFYPGFFPDSASKHVLERFAFAHIDVDIHSSVLNCCEWFYPRMARGGIMLFDDYGTKSCAGAKKAVDDFFADKKEAVIYSPATQAFVIKL